MKAIVVTMILIVGFLALPVMAAIPMVMASDFSSKSSVVYIEKETTTNIITTFLNAGKSMLGMEQEPVEVKKTTVVVQIDGNAVAEIPKGSKFEGMEVHDYCLLYQYGTDNWYNCEVSLQ